MENKKDKVLSIVKNKIIGSDLQFSFLVAACSSYRHDTVLRPFPPHYMESEHASSKQYDRLVRQ